MRLRSPWMSYHERKCRAWSEILVYFLRKHAIMHAKASMRSFGTSTVYAMPSCKCGYHFKRADFRHHLLIAILSIQTNITLEWIPGFFMKLKHPDNKVHGANMGPTWVLSAPDGPHVGPINLAIRAAFGHEMTCCRQAASLHLSQCWPRSVKSYPLLDCTV